MELEHARRLAQELMAEHGLDGWTFAFDRAVRRAGSCQYGTQRITLSRALTELHDEAEVRATVLHEIAHALCPGEGHSARWRRTAISIGSTGERCLTADTPRIPGAWVGTCPAGHTVDRHRAPSRVLSCSRCSSSFTREHVLSWTHHGRVVEMPPAYRLELARIEAGVPQVRVGVGGHVRIVVPGRYDGVVGRVVKQTRASYVVRTKRHGLLKLPLSGAVPA